MALYVTWFRSRNWDTLLLSGGLSLRLVSGRQSGCISSEEFVVLTHDAS